MIFFCIISAIGKAILSWHMTELSALWGRYFTILSLI